MRVIMNNDEEAIRVAGKTVVRVKPSDVRIVRIRNTLELLDIQVSEPMMAEVRARPDLYEIKGKPGPLKFDAEGTLKPIASMHHEHANPVEDPSPESVF